MIVSDDKEKASKLTSSDHLKTMQFRDQMADLNKCFLKQLRCWFEQCPHYDFTETVKSYIKHVEKLDGMYALSSSKSKTDDENSAAGATTTSRSSATSNTPRVIAKAKRRKAGGAGDGDSSFVSSTPASSQLPRMSLGNVSVIEADTTPKPSSAGEKEKDGDTTIATNGGPSAAAGGRKRAIRGGGPLGGSESVVFRGTDNSSSASSVKIPPVTVNLPKFTAGFWGTSKDENKEEKKEESNKAVPTVVVSENRDENAPCSKKAPAFSGFNLLKSSPAKSSEKSSSPESQSTETPKQFPLFSSSPSSTFKFGNINKEKSEDSTTSSTFEAKPFLSFGKKSDDNDKCSSAPFALKKPEGEGKSDPSPTPSLFQFGKTDSSSGADKKDGHTKPALSFPSFSNPASSISGETKPVLSFPSLQPGTLNLFGTSGGSGSTLTFGPPKTDDGNANGDENEEYVPPVAEVVENSEPGSTYSTKCSIFKMEGKEYTKLGVGMFNLMDKDGKKSVLVRAATTIGNVWINALINKTMKAVKVESDKKGEKMILSFPTSADALGKYLIRFPNAASNEKVQKFIDENSQ